MSKTIALIAIFFIQCSFAEHLKLLHFNDTYELYPRQQDNGSAIGGFAQLKTLITKQKHQTPHTFVTFGGDMRPGTIDGNPLDSLEVLEVLNHMNLDAAVFGNHEFDEGPEQTLRFIQRADFPWISSNILDNHGNPIGGAPPYKIRKVGRFKVALIGLLTPETKALSTPGEGIFFAPIVETAKAIVQELKAQDVDLVIALTHLNLKEDKELLSKVPEIDLILGGHEHEPITTFVGGRMIHKSGSDAEYLGVIDLEMDKANGKLVLSHHWEMIPITKIKADPHLKKHLDVLHSKASGKFERPLAKTEVPIESYQKSVRTQQTPVGSLVADALRHFTQADIGIINGGSLRGNCSYPAGHVLTLKDIANELAFRNTAVVRKITGAILKDIMEAALELTPDPTASFPHVSGFSVLYDSSRPRGQKVLKLTRQGKSIHPHDKLTLATTNYLADGGDGLPNLAKYQGSDTKAFYLNVAEKYLLQKAVITKDILKPRISEESQDNRPLLQATGTGEKLASAHPRKK